MDHGRGVTHGERLAAALHLPGIHLDPDFRDAILVCAAAHPHLLDMRVILMT
jgi:hypothetical protein